MSGLLIVVVVWPGASYHSVGFGVRGLGSSSTLGVLAGNLLEPSVLMTLLSLVATLIGLVVNVKRRREAAFDEYRRCKSLLRRVSDKYDRFYNRIVEITLCLSDVEKDRREIEDLLFRYSNMLAELGEFRETGCPKIHFDVDKIARKYITVGIIYIGLGLALTLSGPRSLVQAVFALVYGFLGLWMIHSTHSKAIEKIEDYKLVLDNMQDNLKLVEDNLERIEKMCGARKA